MQPPLPTGDEEELVGTERWCAVDAVIASKKTSLGWFDLKRGGAATEEDALLDERESGSGVEEEWWPELGRWRLGVRMEDAEITFGEKESWTNRTLQ